MFAEHSSGKIKQMNHYSNQNKRRKTSQVKALSFKKYFGKPNAKPNGKTV